MARFRPSIAALLATTAVVALCLRLGVWQLERADIKQRWLDQQQQRAQSAPLSLDAVLALDDRHNQPVRVRGQFDNDRVILLDNRVLERVAGYHVITPLQTNGGRWVLVNRGWIARGPDRNQLPVIAAIDGEVTVEGFSYQYSERTFTLAEDDLSAVHWPLRVQKVDMDAISAVLGVELAPFEIRPAPGSVLESGAQLPRVWHDPVMGPERHRGYALQWFAMALAALVFFLVAGFRRGTELQRERTP